MLRATKAGAGLSIVALLVGVAVASIFIYFVHALYVRSTSSLNYVATRQNSFSEIRGLLTKIDNLFLTSVSVAAANGGTTLVIRSLTPPYSANVMGKYQFDNLCQNLPSTDPAAAANLQFSSPCGLACAANQQALVQLTFWPDETKAATVVSYYPALRANGQRYFGSQSGSVGMMLCAANDPVAGLWSIKVWGGLQSLGNQLLIVGDQLLLPTSDIIATNVGILQ